MSIGMRRAHLDTALTDWTKRGLLPPETAAALRADMERGDAARAGAGFTGFVLIAGIICVAFAALSFVAANWNDIPRLARVALLIGSMLAAWGGAVWAWWRGWPRLFPALVLLACCLFGTSIMLVSQIYHIQGEAVDAVWLWALGTLIAAAASRSSLALLLAAGLWLTWHLMLVLDFSGGSAPPLNLAYLGWWAALALTAWWSRSRAGAHVLAISLAVWGWSALILLQPDMADMVLVLTGLLGLAAIGLIGQGQGPKAWHGYDLALLHHALFHALVMAFLLYTVGADLPFVTGGNAAPALWAAATLPVLFGLAIWGQVARFSTAYDLWATAIAAALAVLFWIVWPSEWLVAAWIVAAGIWVTRMGWRLDNRLLRALGMTVFALAILAVYGRTVGSLIGTSGFYLGAGAILLIGALVGSRIRAGKGDET